jgi:hypothetical protein
MEDNHIRHTYTRWYSHELRIGIWPRAGFRSSHKERPHQRSDDRTPAEVKLAGIRTGRNGEGP